MGARPPGKGTLSSWLRTQIDSIRPATPIGLQVRTALGIQRYLWETPGYPWETPARRSRNTALYVVLLLLIIGAGDGPRYHHAATLTHKKTAMHGYIAVSIQSGRMEN